jgi:hypothetical protein
MIYLGFHGIYSDLMAFYSDSMGYSMVFRYHFHAGVPKNANNRVGPGINENEREVK